MKSDFPQASTIFLSRSVSCLYFCIAKYFSIFFLYFVLFYSLYYVFLQESDFRVSSSDEGAMIVVPQPPPLPPPVPPIVVVLPPPLPPHLPPAPLLEEEIEDVV